MTRPVLVDVVIYIMGAIVLTILGEEEKCEYFYSYRQSFKGIFESPRFPDNYAEMTTCHYYFDASPDGRIHIQFKHFELEDKDTDDISCRFDYIDMFNVDYMGYKSLINRFCGKQLPPNITSAQPRMELIFVSDYTKTATGFLGEYTFLDDNWQPFETTKGCGTQDVKNQYGGVITSPDHPSPFPGMSKCAWQIRVKEGHQILIQILALDMGPTSQCTDKKLLIYNGFATPETLPVKTLCGQLAAYDTSNSKYLSSSSKIVIRFLSESDNRRSHSTGFKLSWTSVRLPGSGSCYDFLCAGGRQCVQTICPTMPRYCINKALICDGVPNCGPYDDSDERKCPREIIIMTACIALPSLAVIGLIVIVIYCYRSKRVKKSLSQEQPLANQRQVSRDSSRSQYMMHTSFIDGKTDREDDGQITPPLPPPPPPEKLDNGTKPREFMTLPRSVGAMPRDTSTLPRDSSFKTHQKRASYHMMKQTFEDNNFIIAEI